MSLNLPEALRDREPVTLKLGRPVRLVGHVVPLDAYDPWFAVEPAVPAAAYDPWFELVPKKSVLKTAMETVYKAGRMVTDYERALTYGFTEGLKKPQFDMQVKSVWVSQSFYGGMEFEIKAVVMGSIPSLADLEQYLIERLRVVSHRWVDAETPRKEVDMKPLL